MAVKEIGDNLFLFEFTHVVDKFWVLDNGPWTIFDTHLVILKVYDGDERPSQIVLNETSLWIQVFDLFL